MRIEQVYIWRCIESELRWNAIGHVLHHMFHSVNFRSAEAWLVVGETKALLRIWETVDVQSQLNGVVGTLQNNLCKVFTFLLPFPSQELSPEHVFSLYLAKLPICNSNNKSSNVSYKSFVIG